MIPLNRPYDSSCFNGDWRTLLDDSFPSYNYDMCFASRDGLNLIYRNLYERYGSMEVAVSPLSCFIALYPIVTNGHVPVFVDINEDTLNIDEKELIGKDVQAAQIIYLGGNPIDIDTVACWSREKNVKLIEDCAQAWGSTYKGKRLGSIGDYAVFSMVKNVYAECGGLLLSRDDLCSKKDEIISNWVLLYKKIKRNLEKRTSHNWFNLFNLMYCILLNIKESSESGIYTKVRAINETKKLEILDLLSYWNDIDAKRYANASMIINGIDVDKYTLQKEIVGGKSNRNRLLLISKNRLAKDIIRDLRRVGIAANNLTQSYLNGFQDHVSKDCYLARYYDKPLEVYEEVFPYLVSIPNSPSLKNAEIEYIVNMVNKVN